MSESTFTHRQRRTLVATSVGLFMIYLDATIVNVALPDIQRDFDTGEQGLQWVVAAYSLTMGMFMMSSATLADLHGRRRLFLLGAVLFSLASALCGAAPAMFVLNLGRALQGVGAAVVNVASLALVSAAFPDPKTKAKAIGLWTGIAAIGLAVGPTLGGVMSETLGWRSVFYVNLLIGGLAIVLVRAYVEESRSPTGRSLDLRGQVLFIVAVGALTYALIEGPHDGWASPEILGLLAGALVIGAAFVLAELRASEPMMDVRVFGDRVYTAAILAMFVVMFCAYGTLLVVSQYLQNVRDYSAERAGLVLVAQTVPIIVLAPIAGKLAASRGGRRPTLAGLAVLVLAMVVAAVGVGGPVVFVATGLVLLGVAAGLAVAPTTNIAMASIPPERAGMASGILSAQRALGSTTGFAVMGSVLAAVVAATLPAKFEPYLSEPERSTAVDIVAEDANPRAVASIIGPGKPLPDAVAQQPELVEAADEAFVEGIRIALGVGAGLTVLVLVLGFLVFPKSTRDETQEEHEEHALRVEEAAG